MTATTELVVPKSMPIIFAIVVKSSRNRDLRMQRGLATDLVQNHY
jgi:hypothetical protein